MAEIPEPARISPQLVCQSAVGGRRTQEDVGPGA